MTIGLLIAVATALARPEAPPVPAVPEVSILILGEQDAADSEPKGSEDLVSRMVELFVTMQDLGIIRYRSSKLDPGHFATCMAMPDRYNWNDDRDKVGRNGCIGKLLPATEDGVPLVAVLVENMTWRSAAQQLTCISPDAAVIERTSIHLKDISHLNIDVRRGSRETATRCIAAALGGRNEQ